MSSKHDSVDTQAVLAKLENTLFLWARLIAMELRVMAPAHVLVFDPARARASVVLGHLPIKAVEGVPVPQPPINLVDVPVSLPRGMGGQAYQSLPLVPGDTGHVIFSDRDLTTWLESAGPVPVDPVSGAVHGLSGGLFTPGLHKTADVTPTDMTAHVIEGPLVKVGAAAIEFALRGTELAAVAATTQATLSAVPPAADPATVLVLSNANTAAILALTAAISSAISEKMLIE